jgi:hypothetical protein
MLLSYCAQNNIPLVIVKMPTKSLNIAMMPNIFRNRYDHDVQAISSKFDTQLIDFSSSKTFQNNDFADLVHLNAQGGTMFRRILQTELATKIRKDSALTNQSTTAQSI